MGDDIEYQNLLYKRGDSVEVYKGKRKSDNLDICIKVLYTDELIKSNEILQETYVMFKFSDHPNIVKIFDAQINESGGRIFVRVIMEYFPLGDLKSFISVRARQHAPFSEVELLEYLKQIVSAFAFLEEKKFAHGDIKPENIFVAENATKLVVGDLGSAREKKQHSITFSGTPLYLSPELRVHYSKMISDTPLGEFQYDSYKSDVYSLGLTLLYMATLQEPIDIYKINDHNFTLNKVSTIQSPTIQQLLSRMLALDPDQRISFKELDSFLSPKVNKEVRCNACDHKVGDNYREINSKNFCENCIVKLNKNYWNFHKLCFNCGQPLIINQENGVNQAYCSSCNGMKICAYCKLMDHPGFSCFQYQNSGAITSYHLLCPECQNQIQKFRGYFLHCPNRHYYCVVCNKTNGDSHSLCVSLFQAVLS